MKKRIKIRQIYFNIKHVRPGVIDYKILKLDVVCTKLRKMGLWDYVIKTETKEDYDNKPVYSKESAYFITLKFPWNMRKDVNRKLLEFQNDEYYSDKFRIEIK